MPYDFKSLKEKLKTAEEWFRKELSSIRTGRATPAILDTVLVESYGAKMPVQQLASLSLEDARSLRVSPYDTSQTKNIEKAILKSNLGLSVVADDKGLRVVFPELTAERRDSYLKIAKERLEETRKKLRTARDDVWKDIQTQERSGKVSEDEKFRLKNDMQKLVDETTKRMDDLFAKKEKEILN